MNKKDTCWFSPNLQRDMNVKVYGHTGLPLLVFPTQNAMSDNFENFGMIETLADEINRGNIQLFCVDTVDSETWSNVWGDKEWRAQRQEQYFNYIKEEVLPFVNNINSTNRLPVTVGCSLGGLHAAIFFFRRPELFSGMLSLSGVYDAKFFFDGWLNQTLYENSPIDFLANIWEGHPDIQTYNQKKIILCVGQGRWEDEGRRTIAIMRDIFNGKHINAWVDFWGFDVDHDWVWWKKQIIYFLPHFLNG